MGFKKKENNFNQCVFATLPPEAIPAKRMECAIGFSWHSGHGTHGFSLHRHISVLLSCLNAFCTLLSFPFKFLIRQAVVQELGSKGVS